MKFLALDFGQKRLGLAFSDPSGSFALPHGARTRQNNDNRGDIEFLTRLVKTHEVSGLVLGIPSGSQSSEKTANQARRFAQNLRLRLEDEGISLQIFEQDERFSSSLASAALRESGVSSRAAREDGLVDANAAAAFLQTFLDKQKAELTNWGADLELD